MPVWEYRKIDLNQQGPRSDDLDMLNDAGAEGWELVGIVTNNIAYLKREVEDTAHVGDNGHPLRTEEGRAHGSSEQGDQGVKVKYRDPKTNDTWSGRGRMAGWLRNKLEAGEKIEKYLV